MEDILAATGLVFLVEPTAVGDHGVYAPTVLCRCRVLQAYVGQPIYLFRPVLLIYALVHLLACMAGIALASRLALAKSPMALLQAKE